MFPERFDKIIQFLPNGQSVSYTKGAGLQGISYLRNGETYVFISADDNDHIVCDGVVATTAAPPTTTPIPITGATKLGGDIHGEASGDLSGYSVSLSSDGSRVAIGANLNDGGGENSGHVRIYDWSGSAWTQVGADIDGEASPNPQLDGGDQSGYSVSLSSDGSRVAIGAPTHPNTGNVRIYDWSGSAWTQVGADIHGEASGDISGYSVSLSSDGSRVAIGAPHNDDNGDASGHVRIYSWTGSAWNQLGSDIDGEGAYDSSGNSVSLSSDGSKVAIGAWLNDGPVSNTNQGHVRIYRWLGSAWTQVGADIDGKSGHSGWSVSLSSDGSRVAIGAKGSNNYSSNKNGHVRIYDWSGSAWIQAGSDIEGEANGDEFGYSVSLSSDGSRLAIGAPSNENDDTGDGYVRIYDWLGAGWSKVGADIRGTGTGITGDKLGHSVSLNSDGERVAIGGVPVLSYPLYTNRNSGLVRVYQLGSISNTTTTPPPPTLTFRNIVGDNGCNGSISEFPKCIPCSPTSSSHLVKTKEEDGVITFKVLVNITNPNTSELQYIWEYKSYTTECVGLDWTRFGTSNSSANQYGVTTVPTVDFNYNCVAGQSLRIEVRCTALMGNENTRTISNSYYYKCDNELDTSEMIDKFDLLVSTPENASEASLAGFTTISRGFVLDDKQYNFETEQCEYRESLEGGSYYYLDQPSDRLGDRSLLQLPFSESTKEAIRQTGKVTWFIRRPSDASKPLVDDVPSNSFQPIPTDATGSSPSTVSFLTLSSYYAGDDPTTVNLSSIDFSALHTGVYEIKAIVELGAETYSSSVVSVFSINYLNKYSNVPENNVRGLIDLGDRSSEKHCSPTNSYPAVVAPSFTADIAIFKSSSSTTTGWTKQNVYVAAPNVERESAGLFDHIFPTSRAYIRKYGDYVTRNNLKIVYSERTVNSPSGRSMYRIQNMESSEVNPVLISPSNLNTVVWGYYDPDKPICAFGRYYPHNMITPWNNGVVSPLSSSKYNVNATDPYPAQISSLINGNTLIINLKTVDYYGNALPTLPDIIVSPIIEHSNDGGANWWTTSLVKSVVKKNNHWQSTVSNRYSSGSRGWYSGTIIRYTPTGFAGLHQGSYDYDTAIAGGYSGAARRQLTDPSIPINLIFGSHSLYTSRNNLPVSPFSQTYSIP